MCLYIPLEWEKYYKSILSKIEKVLKTIIKNISLFLLAYFSALKGLETGCRNKDSLRSSCRMCTQFPGCFLILSQYLLLAKKASNLQKKQKNFNFECIMYKSFLNSNFDFF